MTSLSRRDKRSTRALAAHLAFAVAVLLSCASHASEKRPLVAREIRVEATRSAADPKNHPLPLASHWHAGNCWADAPSRSAGLTSATAVRLVEDGHYVIPWFGLQSKPEGLDASELPALARASSLGVPISIVSTQWEHLLSDDPGFLKLPPAANPNVVTASGRILPKVSPFGPIDQWQRVGSLWAQGHALRLIQARYPNPPLVLFLSNNEHARLSNVDAEQDVRFDRSGSSSINPQAKRSAVSLGFRERYREMISAFRAGLSPAWRPTARFVGFSAFGPSFLGRWDGWRDYSTYSRGQIDIWHTAWDGASPPYYVNDWNDSADFRVMSPQIEAMNWVFMLDRVQHEKPEFWFEISIWDGQWTGRSLDRRAYYERLGQSYTPDRYRGMVRFGLWLLRPRSAREFRGCGERFARVAPFFSAFLASVDEVHTNEELRRFWRDSALVENRAYEHPYVSAIPPEMRAAPRWFLLTTTLDPPRPWRLSTEIPVFAIARVREAGTQREWLVYAHSPLADRKKVRVLIPSLGWIAIDVPVGGAFYHVGWDRKIRRVG